MTLVNFEQQTVLAMLEKNLLDSITNNKFVNVHIQSDGLEMSNCIIPDDVIIENDIIIMRDNFQVTIKTEEADDFDIEYDEFENGYHIHCNNADYYIDFI